MSALKWDEWLASREAKREILRKAGLSAPSRRKTSYNTSERHMKAVFGGERIPRFALAGSIGKAVQSLALAVALAFTATNAVADNVQHRIPFNGTYLYYHTTDDDTGIVIENIRNIHDNRAAFEDVSKISGDIAIPSQIDGLQVVGIGSYAFDGCINMISVAMPEGVTNISQHAFNGCSSLKAFSLPETIASIGDSAFQSCSALRQVSASAQFLAIGNSAFQSCGSLTNVEFSAASITLGKSAFERCSALLRIEASVSNTLAIGGSAFHSCKSLSEAALNAASLTIGDSAFYGCSSLCSVAFPTNTTSIGSSAFYRCTGLTNAVLDVNVSLLGASAFQGCTALEHVYIGERVNGIGNSAFDGCTSLRELEFHEGLSSIGSLAFYDCRQIDSVHFPSTLSCIGTNAFSSCSGLKSVSFASATTNSPSMTIEEYAFSDCTSLTNFSMSHTVQSIGTALFSGCSSLESVNLSTNLTAISASAFAGCTSLSAISFPPAVAEIAQSAFKNATSLASFTLHSGISTVGKDAFLNTAFWNSQPDGFVYKDSVFLGLKGSCPDMIVIPAGVTAIPDGMLRDYTNVVSVTLPDTLKTIGSYSFYNTGISSINLPPSLTQIGSYAFGECSSLSNVLYSSSPEIGFKAFYGTAITSGCVLEAGETMADSYPGSYWRISSVVVASGTTALQTNAFAGCSSLVAIAIPDTVTSIGPNAFAGCSAITDVTFNPIFAMKDTFPDSYANITSVTLSASATEICDGAFEGCSSLESIDIPYSVETIGARAFYGCSSLADRLIIPENVDSIGDYAFAYCSNLVRVCYYGDCPSSVANNIYVGTKSSLCSNAFYVRDGWATDSTNSTVKTLPGRWPVNLPPGRPIHWWTSESLAKITLSYEGGSGNVTNLYYVANGGRLLGEIEEPEERDGYEFVGWFTKRYGGEEVTSDYEITDSMRIYAHWKLDGFGDEDENDEDEDEGGYDFRSASSFKGYLKDDGGVSGIVEISIAKGKWNTSEEETSAAVTASVTLLGSSKKLKAKGTFNGVSGEVEFATLDKTLGFEWDEGVLAGDFDGTEFLAYESIAGSKNYDKRTAAHAAGEDFAGSYVVSLLIEAAEPDGYSGYVPVTVTVRSTGKASIKGKMPDGKSFTSTSELMVRYSEDGYSDVCLPILVPLYGKKGGFGFVMVFASEGESGPVAIDCVSSLIGASSVAIGEFVDVALDVASPLPSDEYFVMCDISGFEIDGETLDGSISPDGMAFAASGGKWLLPKPDTVKFVRADEQYEIAKDNGNPAGLKLSYSANTGRFSGSFKLYSTTDSSKPKKRAVKVEGVMVNGTGYGFAVLKGVGSSVFLIEKETN